MCIRDRSTADYSFGFDTRTRFSKDYAEKALKSEGYQRNPEADPRSARQKRMDDPDRGINSPAFRAFMAAQQGGSKKKVATKKKQGK